MNLNFMEEPEKIKTEEQKAEEHRLEKIVKQIKEITTINIKISM